MEKFLSIPFTLEILITGGTELICRATIEELSPNVRTKAK